MSFEGYYQVMCSNGHLFTAAYDYDTSGPEEFDCECGAKVAWTNLVNDTNCDNCYFISEEDLKPFLIAEEVVLYSLDCPTCVKSYEPARYRIPTHQETYLLRNKSHL